MAISGIPDAKGPPFGGGAAGPKNRFGRHAVGKKIGEGSRPQAPLAGYHGRILFTRQLMKAAFESPKPGINGQEKPATAGSTGEFEGRGSDAILKRERKEADSDRNDRGRGIGPPETWGKKRTTTRAGKSSREVVHFLSSLSHFPGAPVRRSRGRPEAPGPGEAELTGATPESGHAAT